MKMKKFKLIVLSSLVLSSLAQPVGVLATTEINNTSKVQTKGVSTKAVSNPNLVNISSKSVVSGYHAIWGSPNRWQSVYWDQASNRGSVKGNKVGFTSLESVSGGQAFEMSELKLTIYDNKKITIKTNDKYTIGQALKTEIGKEYKVSTDFVMDQRMSELGVYIDGNGVKSSGNSASGTLEYTFVAKSTSTYLSVELIVAQSLGKPAYAASIDNTKVEKTSSQVAIEELQQLLPTFFDKDGNLGSNITATDLAKAQAFLNKVSAGTEKTKLQATFNKATELLNQRNALETVSALFEEDDVTSELIKETVTQASIDSAKNAINKVTDASKKAELMTYWARAQEFLNQNQAVSALSSLFVDNNPAKDIRDNVTYEMITAANVLIEKVTDEARKSGLQEGAKKAKDLLDARIEEATNQKAAETAINGLFKGNNPASGAIVEGLAQETIEQAKTLANKVKDETKKASLLDSIAIGQELLNERLNEEAKVASIRESISNLFQDNNISGSIREDLTQDEIDKVVTLVETIKDFNIQLELNKQITNAQIGLNALNAEKEDSAEAAVNGLFQNNDPTAEAIKGGLTQEMINKAAALTSQVLDEDKKAEYQANIALAQSLLNERIAEANRQAKATEAVNALFVNANPGSGEIIVGLTQDAVNSAKALIDVVTAPSKKEALQKTLATAQNLLTSRIEEENRQKLAIIAVNALFEKNDPATGKIVANLTKELIDAAEALAEKVTNTSVKRTLLGHVNVAEELLEERIIENSLIAAAQKEVNGLFQNNDPEAGVIIEGLTQTHIDAAKVTANKVQTQAKKDAFLAQIEVAQKELYKQIIEKENVDAASKVVAELFKDNDPTIGIIKDEVTQKSIDAAKELIGFITDKEKKAELLNQLNDAQNALNNKLSETENQAKAEKAVNELFTDNDPTTGTIKESVTQATIDAATALAGKVSNEDKNKELLATILVAQTAFDKHSTELAAQVAAEKSVNELFADESHTSLADKVTQEDITAASELVAKLQDGEVKNQLLNELKKAEELIKTDDKFEIASFELGKSRYVEGTFTDSNVKKVTLEVNTKVLKQINASEGNFKYWALDQIKSVSDEVYLLAYDASGKEISKQKVNIIESAVASTFTLNSFIIGKDNYLTGTYSGTIARVALRVDGDLKQSILVKDNAVKYYAKDKIKDLDTLIELVGYDVTGAEVSVQEVKVSDVIATSVVSNFRIGEGYVTGTYTGDAKYFGITVNGIQKQIIGIKDNGFKYYAKDKILKGTDDVRVTLYDENKIALDTKKLTIIQTTGTIELSDYKFNDAYIEGTYTDDVVKVRLVVDGVTQKTIPVSNGVIKYYARNIIADPTDKAEIVALDSTGNILDTKELIITE